MPATVLELWGYNPKEIRDMVTALRTARGDSQSGDTTPGEIALVTMLVAGELLKRAGYIVKLRHEEAR